MGESINGPKVKPGEFMIEEFRSVVTKQPLWQLDYRAPDGELFSCIAKNPAMACAKRDDWIARKYSKYNVKNILSK